MAALQRDQLNRLCSSTETFEKAQSILRLVDAKTRPGSGFVVKNRVPIPAVCAYLASKLLNTGEVSLQSAMSAACVSQAEFADILKKIDAALHADEEQTFADVTYGTLVDMYRVYPREDVIACMEDAESSLPQVKLLKERHGASTLVCAVFYWVCQLLEEPSVQERPLCQTYTIHPKTFKAILTALDKHCDSVAEQIRSHLLPKRDSTQGSSSQSNRMSKPPPVSPQKSPIKSALRPQKMTRQISTPRTRSRKHTMAFPDLSLDDHNDHDASYPETPTKKRRVDSAASPIKPSKGTSPTKYSSAGDTTAFHAALRGSPSKLPAGHKSESPIAGPSTPRRPRPTQIAQVAATPVRADSLRLPSRSQGYASPTQPTVRHRFRPVFLEQQQWCTRDPKVERMWIAAETRWEEMVALHGQPFQRVGHRGGAVVGVA